jgi:dihydroorotase
MASLAVSSRFAFAQQARRFDILIKNGEVWDPSRGFRQRADVAIQDGRIALIEPEIPAEHGLDVVDAKDLYVTPGLVDLHTHIHYGTALGIPADPVAAHSGTTTFVDAGTFAYNETAGFRKFIVEPAQARVFGYVHLYPSNRNPSQDPLAYTRNMMDRTGRTAVENHDIILGVKLQVGSNMSGRYSFDLLKIARELCDKYQLPFMAHISSAPPETDQVMALMRPGDVVTHCFTGHTLRILDESGKIKPSVLDARKRGVLFDVGHGSGSFNFEIASKALEQGFLPDSISTDVYDRNVNGPVYDMTTTMSKLLYLGMSFDEVLLRSTKNPSDVVDRVPGMGTLNVGGPADIALLALEEGNFKLVDSQRNTESANRRIVSHLTICRGKRLAMPIYSSNRSG